MHPNKKGFLKKCAIHYWSLTVTKKYYLTEERERTPQINLLPNSSPVQY